MNAGQHMNYTNQQNAELICEVKVLRSLLVAFMATSIFLAVALAGGCGL